MSLGDRRSYRKLVPAALVATFALAAGHPGVVSASPTGGGVLALGEGVGDRGVAVEIWQDRLNVWLRLTGSPLYPIVVDGDFGPQTETATREFQRANAAVVNDGTVDDDDRVALEAAISTLEATGGAATADDGDEARDDTDGPSQPDITLTWWQTALNSWLLLTDSDLYPIVVDGIFGPQTETATREFQRADDDVDNDGTVDDDDRVAIEAAIETLESAPAATDGGADSANDATTPDVTLTWWQIALNRWLQLADSDLYPIVVDGAFGAETETATREFQSTYATLDVDGTVDPIDRVVLEDAIAALEGGATLPGAGAADAAESEDAADDEPAAEGRADAPDDQVDALTTSDDVSETVRWWQARLNEWLDLVTSAMFPIVIDGWFGPQTEAATIEFQSTEDSLDADGEVDQLDRVVLDQAVEELEAGGGGPADVDGGGGIDGNPATDGNTVADGSSGELVTWWQAGLNEWLLLTSSDLYPILVDGDFGPQTETATRAFQSTVIGLAVDGSVSDADRVALENAIDAFGG